MTDLLIYEVFHSDDHTYVTDGDGEALLRGWYYQFPEAEPVGPFSTSGRAEFAAEAEIEEFESALADEF